MRQPKFKNIILIIAIAIIILLIIYKYPEIKESVTGFPGKVLPYNGQTIKPLKFYTVASNYGYRLDPFTQEEGFHNGIDLVTLPGMAVRAAKDGNIVRMEYDPTGYGNWIEIQHPDGTFTRYAHLSAFGNVTVEQHVGAGSVIGAVGSTGRSTQAHLHFELRDKDGNSVDPSSLLGIPNTGNNVVLHI